MSASPSERIAKWTALALLVVAAAWHGLRPLVDLDVWWQLKLGEQILATQTLVDRDPFSFTFADTPWPYKDAGAAVIMWLLWTLGGSAALVIAKAVLLVVTVVMVFQLLHRVRGLAFAPALVGSALAFEALAFRFSERPASVAITATVLVLVLVERDRRDRRGLWWSVLVTAVLANLHRSAVLLPLLLGAHAAVCTLEAKLLGQSRRWQRAWAIAIAAAIATLATPFGLAIYTTTATLVDAHAAMMTEWAPPTYELVRALSPASFGTALLAVLAIVLGLARSPRAWWDVVLATMALALGSQALRHLPLLAIFAVGPGMTAIAARSEVWTGRLRHVIACGAAMIALVAQLARPLATPSLGLTPAHYPERGLAFVRSLAPELRPRGPLFHEFAYGGFFIFHLWPDHRVYIDGRTDLVYPSSFVARWLAATSDPRVFAEETERWDLQWVWLDNAPFRGARAFFDRDPRWALVHVSQRSLIYVRRDGDNAVLAEQAYRWLSPHDLTGSLARAHAQGRLDAALGELERMIAEDPDNPYPQAVLAQLHQTSH
ncbi:MAG TPA: hypothetical protein VG755_08575 [Nannocystaceae bacterium]|nr:hypothetical protein [Nannocystaceae bacterium]